MNTVGCSKETALKQKDLKRILGVGVGIAGWENKKKKGRGPYYRFFDFTSGPGVYRHHENSELIDTVYHGSPMLIMDLLEKENKKTGLGFHATFIDKSKKNLDMLKINHNRHYDMETYKKWVKYVHGNYRGKGFREVLNEAYDFTYSSPTQYPSHPIGMIYCDTNGGCPDFYYLSELLGANAPNIAKALYRIDLLLHLQIGFLKKTCKGVFVRWNEHKCSIDCKQRVVTNPYQCLSIIPKKYMYARECVNNKKKSTLVLFTNWNGYEDRWKNHGFMNDKDSRDMLECAMDISTYKQGGE